MAGRLMTPTALKLLRGNPGHRPLPENEAKPPVKLPKPPAYLQSEARKEWKRTGAKLAALGLMTTIDATAFAAYCECYARWLDAIQGLRKFGLVVQTPTTVIHNPDGSLVEKAGKFMMNPFLRVVRETHDQMVVMLREFGMTPAARSRVHAQTAEEEDALDSFIRKAG